MQSGALAFAEMPHGGTATTGAKRSACDGSLLCVIKKDIYSKKSKHSYSIMSITLFAILAVML